MSDFLSIQEIVPLIEEQVENGGCFYLVPKGKSMLPTIKEGIDTVVLERATSLKRGDILLYRRKNGQYVLHRLVKIKNGNLTMCGDAQLDFEFNITEDDIIAMVTEIIRNGKSTKISSTKFKLCFKYICAKRKLKAFLLKSYKKIRKK